MEDFPKEPKKAAPYYREESLRAMAAGEKIVARYWRLTWDIVNQALRQGHSNSILVPMKMPFVDGFIQLGFSLQKTHEILDAPASKKKNHVICEDDLSQEVFSHYRYWTRYLLLNCSYRFEREIQQLLDAEKKYSQQLSKTADPLKRALYSFKKAQQHRQHQPTNPSLQEELLVVRWISAAYEAAHVANIFIQHEAIAATENHLFLEHWKKMVCNAEQALALRIQAAEATEQKKEEEAIQYSLAAFAMNHVSEGRIEMMKAVLSGHESLVQQWELTFHLPKKIVAIRMAIATLPAANSFLQDFVNWLEAAWEADLKRLEALSQEYHRVAFYWEQSREASKHIADLYYMAATKMNATHRLISWCHQIKRDYFEKKARTRIPIMFMEEVFFCMPQSYYPSKDFRKRWEGGDFTHFAEDQKSLTVNAWLYQTGFLLQQAGVRCHFYTKMPHLPCRGILITMSGFLYGYPKNLALPRSLFMADIPADEGIPRPISALHLIPNQHTTRYLPFSEFIPHWSQPLLIPRSAERGDRFETVCFMGSYENIATELLSKEWHERLERELGLRFIYRKFDRWYDFSDVDCIVAIRDFSGRRYCYKPAHKLNNAWLAGVPFIGGSDSAFAGDGHPGEDYLIANSAEEVFKHLKKLKEAPAFRSQLVERGRQSGIPFTREVILQSWKRLVQETLPVAALKWYQASAVKRAFLRMLRRGSCDIQSIIYKYYKSKKSYFVSGSKPDPLAWTTGHQS